MEKIWFMVSLLSVLVHHQQSCEGRKLHDSLGSASADYVTNWHLHNSKMKQEQQEQEVLDKVKLVECKVLLDQCGVLLRQECYAQDKARYALDEFVLLKDEAEDANDLSDKLEDLNDYLKGKWLESSESNILEVGKKIQQIVANGAEEEVRKKANKELLAYFRKEKDAAKSQREKLVKDINAEVKEFRFPTTAKAFDQIAGACDALLKEDFEKQEKIGVTVKALQADGEADAEKVYLEGKKLADYLTEEETQKSLEEIIGKKIARLRTMKTVKGEERINAISASMKQKETSRKELVALVQTIVEKVRPLSIKYLLDECERLFTDEANAQQKIKTELEKHVHEGDQKDLDARENKLIDYLTQEEDERRLEKIRNKIEELEIQLSHSDNHMEQLVKNFKDKRFKLEEDRERFDDPIKEAFRKFWIRAFKKLVDDYKKLVEEETEAQGKIQTMLDGLSDYLKTDWKDDEVKEKDLIDKEEKLMAYRTIEEKEKILNKIRTKVAGMGRLFDEHRESLEREEDSIYKCLEQMDSLEKGQQNLDSSIWEALQNLWLRPIQKLADDCEHEFIEEEKALSKTETLLNGFNGAANDLILDESVVNLKWKELNDYCTADRLGEIHKKITKIGKKIAGHEQSMKVQNERLQGLTVREKSLKGKRKQLDKLIGEAMDNFWPDKVVARISKRVQDSVSKLNEKKQQAIEQKLNALKKAWNTDEMTSLLSLVKKYSYNKKDFIKALQVATTRVGEILQGLSEEQRKKKQSTFSAFDTKVASWDLLKTHHTHFLEKTREEVEKLRGQHQKT